MTIHIFINPYHTGYHFLYSSSLSRKINPIAFNKQSSEDEIMHIIYMKFIRKRIGQWVAIFTIFLSTIIIGSIFGFMAFREQIRTANKDIGKIVSPRGIDEAKFVRIGGVRQWITIRGQDRDKPILLFLHGGPGSAMADLTYAFQRPWEDEFVVVQWDQRGAGRSAIDMDALKGTVTLEQLASDTAELLTYLNRRFGRKVVLLGQSWGSLLGSEVAKRRPDLLQAFVSLGQITSWEENFAEGQRLLIEHARKTGDKTLEEKMLAMGPQPRALADPDGERAWATQAAVELGNRGHAWHNSNGPWAGRMIALALASPTIANWDVLEIIIGNRQLAKDNLQQLIRGLSGWKIERNVGTKFKVPVIMMMGSHDWQTPTALARNYYEAICAPYKVWIEFPYSAHVIVAEEPGRFQRALIEKVLPAAEGRIPDGAERCTQTPRP